MVHWISSDVLEEYAPSTFKAQEWAEEESIVNGGGKQSLYIFLRNARWPAAEYVALCRRPVVWNLLFVYPQM